MQIELTHDEVNVYYAEGFVPVVELYVVLPSGGKLLLRTLWDISECTRSMLDEYIESEKEELRKGIISLVQGLTS